VNDKVNDFLALVLHEHVHQLTREGFRDHFLQLSKHRLQINRSLGDDKGFVHICLCWGYALLLSYEVEGFSLAVQQAYNVLTVLNA
jgi:hypothetical protein